MSVCLGVRLFGLILVSVSFIVEGLGCINNDCWVVVIFVCVLLLGEFDIFVFCFNCLRWSFVVLIMVLGILVNCVICSL